MTLVVAYCSKKSIWLGVDRRLTFPSLTTDNGRKVVSIAATDGEALLGYAGLGRSSGKTEPSDWMNDLLKKRGACTVEDQLRTIADAMSDEMPAQLLRMGGAQAHYLVAAARVKGEPRLYSVVCDFQGQLQVPRLVYVRHTQTADGGPPPSIALAGSGAACVPRDRAWARETKRIASAVDAGRVSPLAVADRLAALNAKVATKDPFVSPQSIVTWRSKNGGSQFYNGTTRVVGDMQMPAVVNGIDIWDVLMATDPDRVTNPPQSIDEAIERNEAIDIDTVNANLKRLHERKRRKL